MSEAGRAATRPDIDAIRKRAEAATPGPWAPNEYGHVTTPVHHIAQTDWNHGLGKWGDQGRAWPDAEFIAAARQDVPALVAYCIALEAAGTPGGILVALFAEAARLRDGDPEHWPYAEHALSWMVKEIEIAREATDDFRKSLANAEAEIERLEAENARLRESARNQPEHWDD